MACWTVCDGNSTLICSLLSMRVLLGRDRLRMCTLDTALISTGVIKLLACGDFYAEMKFPSEDVGEY